MKKLFFFLAAIFCIGLPVNAQNHGYGSYLSLSVDYYNHGKGTDKHGTGHLEFHNKTGQTISKAHVTVSVLITWADSTNEKNYIPIRHKKTLILCDDDFYNIAPGDSRVERGGKGIVKGGPERPGKTYNYNVEVKYEASFPGTSTQASAPVSSSDELFMTGEVCHAMYKSSGDPAPSRITIDVYKTRDGHFYANMTSPENKKNIKIHKLTGSTYNAYIEYQNNKYGFLLNSSTW